MSVPPSVPPSIPTPLPPAIEPISIAPVPAPSRWSNFLSRFKVGLNLPNPGKYEEFSREAQEITSSQEYFDGMKFDFVRGLSEQFNVHHSLHMGSSDAQGGGTYSFSPSVATKNKKAMIYGRFDGDGRVMARIHYLASQRLSLLGASQVSAEQSMMSVEATYSGNDWTGSVKLEGSSVVEVTMMQSVLKTVGLGMQLLHIPQPHGAITGISAVARLWSSVELLKPLTQQKVPKWVFAVNSGTLTPLHASFTWHTPYKADFATELSVHPRQDGTLESVWCAGALYTFNSGRIRARVDSNARVGVFVEEGISQNMSAYLCGDLDHYQNKYKFGFGITIQS